MAKRNVKSVELRVVTFEFVIPQANGKLKKITINGLYSGDKYRELKLAHNRGELVVNRITNL